MKQIIVCIIFGLSVWCHSMYSIACNGHEELCSRKLNEVTMLGAHNIGYKKSRTRNQMYPFSLLMDMGARFAKVRILAAPASKFKNAPTYTYKGEKYVAVACHGLRRRALYEDLQIKELLKGIPRDELETKHDQKIEKLEKEITQIKKRFALVKKELNHCKQNPFSKKCRRALLEGAKQLFSELKDGLVKKEAELISKKALRGIKSPLLHVLESAEEKLTKEELKLFKMTVGTDENPGPVPFNPCMIDPSTRPFINVLADIKKFLTMHPHDVFILLVEDYVNNLDVVADLFKRAGLDNLVYPHKKGTPWPTLEAMIKQNKRLVVFLQYWQKSLVWGNYPWEKYPWLHKKTDYFLDPSQYDFKTAKELLNFRSTKFKINKARPDQLIFMQHFVTKKVGGDPKQAAQVNTYKALTDRARRIMKDKNRRPSIINIDFVGVPSIEDQLKALRHINGVGEFLGKPLFKLKKKHYKKKTK